MKFWVTTLCITCCIVCTQAKPLIVSSIQTEGNNKTKTSFIQKIIRVKAGDVLDSSKVETDVTRLIRLPSIGHAYFKVKKLNSSDSCTLTYYVQENFTIIPYLNVYTSTGGEFAFRAGLQEFNFTGRNITIGGFYQRDIFNSYGAGIKAPYLFSKNLGLEINYQNLSTQEPVYIETDVADYQYTNKSIQLKGLWEINFHHKITLGGSYFTEDYQYLFGKTSNNVPTELKTKKNLFLLEYTYQDIKYYFQYLSGFKSQLTIQNVHSTNTDLPPFIVAFNDFTYYKRIRKKGLWASRLRAGISTNTNSPFAPFSIDNNINIRGVGNKIDRGTAALVFNTEYRHTLYDKKGVIVQSNVFIDSGTWRNPGGTFNDFSASKNIKVSPGLGLRFIHSKIFNAVFRIDYGVGITKDTAHGLVFGVGQYF